MSSKQINSKRPNFTPPSGGEVRDSMYARDSSISKYAQIQRSDSVRLSKINKFKKSNSHKELPPIQRPLLVSKQENIYDIDSVGTSLAEVSQLFILQRRSLATKAITKKKGIQGGNKNLFSQNDIVKEIQTISMLIKSQLSVEKKHGIKDNRKLVMPYFNRALAYEKVQQIDKAFSDYSDCIRLDDKYAEAYYKRAEIYQIRQEFDSALRDISRAVDLDPSNSIYRTNLAILLRKQGSYLEAINETIICRAVDLNPDLKEDLKKPNFDKSSVMNLDVKLLKYLKKEEDPVAAAMLVDKKLRTVEQLGTIVNFILTSKFFAPYMREKEVLLNIASSFDLFTYRKGEAVFEEGSIGTQFFMILDGEITIVKNETKIVSNVQEVTSKKLVKLFRGQTFGELALNHESGLRTAGAIAAIPTRLLALERDDYHAVTSVYLDMMYSEVRHLLKSNPIFEFWPNEKLEVLVKNVREMSYSPNAEIVKTGEISKYFYMIKLGVVKLLKTATRPKLTVEKTHSQYSRMLPSMFQQSCDIDDISQASSYCVEDEDYNPCEAGMWVLEKNWRDNLITFDLGPEYQNKKLEEQATDKNSYYYQKRRQQRSTHHEPSADEGDTINYTVCALGTGQTFGELAILDNSLPSPVSAVSFTSVNLYAFETSLFTKLEARFMRDSMTVLSELMNLHNPPTDKMRFFFKEKVKWELTKSKVFEKLKLSHKISPL